ncbi:MAG: Mut7-C RNAse domain-containing protein [bacterium]
MARNINNSILATFRFHGDLIELLDRSRRKGEYVATISLRSSIKDAVESQGVPHVEVGLLAVGGMPCGWNPLLEQNEIIDVWGVTDVERVPREWRVDDPDPHPLRFLLDVHLGRLASYLRLLGFDTLYDSNDPGDDRLAAQAHDEARILLTCDRGLLMRNHVRHGRLLRSRNSVEQTREIIQRFHLQTRSTPFSRCLRCNGSLSSVDIDTIRDRIPPRVFRRHGANPTRYRICERCGQLYWEGTHTLRMQRLLAEWGIPVQMEPKQ